MDLVTVINNKFVKNVINLIKSYKHLSYDAEIFIYWFGEKTKEIEDLKQIERVNLLEVPKVVDYAHNPRAFFYKTYAISDCLDKTSKFIYSDSTNCFVSDARELEKDLIDDSLLLAYAHPLLTNQYWTTKKCLESISGAEGSEWTAQYWAGFQAYECTETNVQMLKEMYQLSTKPEVLLPDTTIKRPDGNEAKCIEHRQDQSIFSLLIHKYDKHQKFDFKTADKYGDWQTINGFDGRKTLDPESKNRILMPRESKFGFYRFL